MSKMIVVSGDGHITPPISVIGQYLEPEARAHMDDLIREDVAYLNMRATPARPPRLTVPGFDDRGLVRTGGELGAANPAIRRDMMDAEAIAAEILLSGTQTGTLPFFGSACGRHPAWLRTAGAQAYNRWTADFIATMPDRLFGVLEPGACLDMELTVAELEWGATHGFVSVTVPGSVSDPDLPPLFDPHFDRFWAACDELGLVLQVHAGWGSAQTDVKQWQSAHDTGDGETTGGHDFDKLMAPMQVKGSPIRLALQKSRRPLWQLMAGGVFDRHPGLKLALTEIRADWVPATLAHLTQRFDELHPPCRRSPREYYADHVLVVPSSPHRSEVEMRHEIGVTQFGFGQDFPHWEGLWPNTLQWLQHAFHDVPEEELRAILGGNVIRHYGLDEYELGRVADRIGPDVDDVLGDHPVPEDLVNHFQKRAGYLRSADPVWGEELDEDLLPDLAPLTGASAG
jgi:predicted TIM-barrel fold metal-dependent hydrolase